MSLLISETGKTTTAWKGLLGEYGRARQDLQAGAPYKSSIGNTATCMYGVLHTLLTPNYRKVKRWHLLPLVFHLPSPGRAAAEVYKKLNVSQPVAKPDAASQCSGSHSHTDVSARHQPWRQQREPRHKALNGYPNLRSYF